VKKGVQFFVLIICLTLFVFFKTRPCNSKSSFLHEKPSIPLPLVKLSPSKLVERVVLGETILGLPFYLEIQQFDLKEMAGEEIVAWHLNLLDGPCEEVYISDQRKVYIRKGYRNSERSDTTHGFATLLGERALFLDAYEKEGFFYVCTAEGPLETFKQHETFLRTLYTH